MFNKKDHILHKRGLLSQKDCDFFIEWFEERKDLHVRGTTGGEKFEVPNKKQDTEIILNKSKDFSWIFSHYLKCGIEEYIKKFPFSNRVGPWGADSVYKIQRYYPGEAYFVTHCENSGPVIGEPTILRRILAWMIYLNDVTDGGETEFPSQNKKFQPRRGDLLIWPAYFTHPHHGIVSKTQTKYIITGWYMFKDC
tara:strand:+ start:44 stop:628 length:585 start_codon:yes stop_codon:yes gene_type:complete